MENNRTQPVLKYEKYLVYANGKMVYSCITTSYNQALNDARRSMKWHGYDIASMDWHVTTADGKEI